MHISFILVDSKVPENIGASARAIKTMGFRRLVLVRPCEYSSGPARWLAHGAADILDNAEVYDSLKEATAEMDIIISTTARYRSTKGEYTDIRDLGSLLQKKYTDNTNIALVFGSEESGLSNDDMSLCDITSTISMVAPYPSLNLSQAVMIFAYTLNDIQTNKKEEAEKLPGEHSLALLKSKAELLLAGTDISQNKALKGRIMERLSLAAGTDIKLFHSIANALISKYEKEH
ncbi:MAG: tRNA/rRNA methyltransferase [Bacteroidales bacterium]|nr:tRNA/rRNA methyltransferase [Bacteroidales bacterium]